MRIPDVLAMSMKLWNQLNDEQKKAVMRSRRAHAGLYARCMENLRNEGSRALKSNFTQIITPDKAPFVKR